MLSRSHAPLLAQGDYDQGWIKYQWRWRTGKIQRPAVMERLSAWDPAGPPKQTARPGSNASPLPLGPTLQHQPSRQVGPSFRRLACPSPSSLEGGLSVNPERAGA